jgi:hypothetical protein
LKNFWNFKEFKDFSSLNIPAKRKVHKKLGISKEANDE